MRNLRLDRAQAQSNNSTPRLLPCRALRHVHAHACSLPFSFPPASTDPWAPSCKPTSFSPGPSSAAHDVPTAGHDPRMSIAIITSRDSDLWFECGGLVVTADGAGFRVHKSLLFRLSPASRDVFAISQPVTGSSDDGTAKCTPVVQVSDSAHEMRCTLHVIVDLRQPEVRPFSLASGSKLTSV